MTLYIFMHKLVGIVALVLSLVMTINYRRLKEWSVHRAENDLTRIGLQWQIPFARVGGTLWLIGAITALALLGIQFLFFGF